MKLASLAQQILKEEEEKATIDKLDQAMGSAFQMMGSELKSKEKVAKQDVEQADVQVNEALGVIAVIGIILAAPKVFEILARSLSKLIQVFKSIFGKGSAKGKEEEVAKTIIEFTHKWHKSYIKGLKWILKVTGVFSKAGLKDEAQQQKAAEVVYYTIVAALAVYSGVGAIGAFKGAVQGAAHGGSFSLAGLETAMASIKSKEVVEFIGKLGLKA